MSFHWTSILRAAVFAALLPALAPAPAAASPRLLVDVQTGDVLFSEDASASWHPASLTKLMTANLAFKAAREGRVSGETPIIMTVNAASVSPSKLGIAPGSGLRLDDALSIMLTRSMNDVATAIAENIAGSEPDFVAEMNREAARIGMRGTLFTNASGLPDQRQVSTAEDLAMLALHIIRTYPERRWMFGIPELGVAGRTLRNTNGLIGRFHGADGMKTGYVCGSGFNVISTATRQGRQLLAVVLGAPNTKKREKAASAMLEYGFHVDGSTGSQLSSSSDAPSAALDMRRWSCGKTYPGFASAMPRQPDAMPSVTEQTTPVMAGKPVRRF